MHVAGCNLGLIMQRLVGAGTPREFLAGESAHLMVMTSANILTSILIVASGTEGYRTAEVTLGGVDTRELSSSTMQSNLVDGLYFIGEVVDVTGHLGGYNFQWAWASGRAAGTAI